MAVEQVAIIDADAVLVGGFALSLYGSPRLTGDLDTAVMAIPPEFENARRLSFGGVRTTVDGVPVDFILRDDDAGLLYDEAISRARHIEGVALRVARPEHLLAMKMYAGRKKDEADIEWMLRAKFQRDVDQVSKTMPPLIDRQLAQVIVRQYLGVMAAKDLRQSFELADWMATRPEAEDED